MSNHYSAANLKFPGDDAPGLHRPVRVRGNRRPRQNDTDHGREPVHVGHGRHAAVLDEVGISPRRRLQAPPQVWLPVGFTTFPGEIFRAPHGRVQKATPIAAASERLARAATRRLGRARGVHYRGPGGVQAAAL